MIQNLSINNMAQYKISWLVQSTTTTGKVKATLTLIDATGNEIPNVTAWGDFPGFKELRPEGIITGNLITKNFKGTNWVSIMPEKNLNGTYKPTATSFIQQKSEVIEKAQDRKNDSIKNSSTFRDATLLTIEWRKERLAKGLNTTSEEWQSEWNNCRKWLDARFDSPF